MIMEEGGGGGRRERRNVRLLVISDYSHAFVWFE